jgi:hypothetical protein
MYGLASDSRHLSIVPDGHGHNIRSMAEIWAGEKAREAVIQCTSLARSQAAYVRL